MKNEKQIKKIINDLIKKEARAEAILILSKASDTQMREFLTYYSEDKGNICCMVLDSIKVHLVKNGQMTMGEDDYFGAPMWDDFGVSMD